MIKEYSADSRSSAWNVKTALFLVFLLAVFGLLRFLASLDDFYIDEIWSFYFAKQLKSPLDVFKLNHDNNHILNTLYLYFTGDGPRYLFGRPTFFVFRLLSLIAGIVSLVLVWLIASKRSRVEALIAVFLLGLSYPIVIYASEARGYSVAIMFALLAFMSTQAYIEKRKLVFIPLFWASSILSFLSHSSFIYIYGSIFVWTALIMLKKEGLAGLKNIFGYHFAPAVFTLIYYLFFLKGMVYGGGEVVTPWKEVLHTAAMFTGMPGDGFFGFAALAVLLTLSVIGLVSFWRINEGESIFYVFGVFIIPAMIVILMKPEFLYFRYFLICFPFLYLLSAHTLSLLFNRPGWGKIVLIVVLLLFSVLNSKGIWDLITLGRGHYSEAIEDMISESPDKEVLVGSDHDFRNGMIIGFYSEYFKDKRIIYLDNERRKEVTPDFLLAHNVNRNYVPPAYIFENGFRYKMAKSYEFAGVSGWRWFVYKRDLSEPM